MCGEKSLMVQRWETLKGSPPRVRGEEPPPEVIMSEEGITPACVGRSISAMHTAKTTSDHPRVCGEKSPYPFSHSSVTGSPPRVRGEAGEPAFPAFHLRITPRVCGEKAGLCQDFF